MKKILKIVGISLVGTVLLFVILIGLKYYNKTNETIPTQFIFGEKHIIINKVIGEDGGEIIIADTDTELDGTKIIVPVGSAKDGTKVEVGYYDGEWKQDTQNEFSLPLIININKTLNESGSPIEIHKNAEMAFQIDESSGRLEFMSTVENITYTFRPNNIITFTNITF